MGGHIWPFSIRETRQAGAVIVSDAGIDTWSHAWYVDPDGAAARALQALATQPAARSKILPDKVDGYTVGYVKSHGMAWIERAPSRDSTDRLLRGSELPSVVEKMESTLSDLGIPLSARRARSTRHMTDYDVAMPGEPGRAGVRRLDATVDLRFANGAEGLAFLAGVAAVGFPRHKTEIITEAGGRRVETVYMLGEAGKRRLARVYDKGIESGNEFVKRQREVYAKDGTIAAHQVRPARGIHIRPESQGRYTLDTRRSVEEVAAGFARTSFQRRFLPLWRATEGITVGTPQNLAVKLLELQDREEITASQAKSVAGHLLLDAADAHRQSGRQIRRDRSMARRYGLVLAGGVVEECEVDLHDVIEAALAAESWDE
jgi:hypothetical protein